MTRSKESADKGGKNRPRRRWRRWLFGVLVLYMAAGYLTTAFARVPVESPASPRLPLPGHERTLLSGVFSVHTGRSHDARGTRDQVAAAAVDAGLDFVVIGDHPPDDRRPDWEMWEPQILDGVLIEGGQELRAPEAGKMLAIGADTTYKQWDGPYGRFLNLIRRRDITAIVVHGRGPRGSERWIHPRAMGMKGWEVLDLSEASRARLRGPWSLYHLLTLCVGMPLGLGDEALLHTMREGFNTPAVAAYDSLRLILPMTATAGLNAHPKVALGPLLLPPYRPFFRTLVSHMAAYEPFSSDPQHGQAILTDGIQSGEIFISLGRQEEARGFRLAAILGADVVASLGREGPAVNGTVLRGGFEEDPGRKVVYRILRNGREVTWIQGPDLEWAPPRPGFYRVEVYTYGARFGDTYFRLKPWIFANPIHLMGVGDGSGG